MKPGLNPLVFNNFCVPLSAWDRVGTAWDKRDSKARIRR